jgi:hypothetical protein
VNRLLKYVLALVLILLVLLVLMHHTNLNQISAPTMNARHDSRIGYVRVRITSQRRSGLRLEAHLADEHRALLRRALGVPSLA